MLNHMSSNTQTRRNRNTTNPTNVQTLDDMGVLRYNTPPQTVAAPRRRLRRLRPLQENQPTMDDFTTEHITPNPAILAQLAEMRQNVRSQLQELVQKSTAKRTTMRYEKQFRDLDKGSRKQVTVDRKSIKISEVLAITGRYPERFLIKVGKERYTLTPENSWRIKELFDKLERGAYDELDVTEITTSDGALYEEAVQTDAELTFERVKNTKRRAGGGFFRHINLTHFDLTKYGIYQTEAGIKAEENCLFMSLKHGGFPEEKQDALRCFLRTMNIPEFKLKEVCKEFDIRIKLTKDDKNNPCLT